VRTNVEDGFDLLEQKVRKAADLVRRLQGENKELRTELSRAQGRLGEVESRLDAADRRRGSSEEETQKMDGLAREVRTLRQEREEVRTRIAKLVEVLDSLD
jgi:predicted RNase H-like nuclease (RuvC/YqgF family)